MPTMRPGNTGGGYGPSIRAGGAQSKKYGRGGRLTEQEAKTSVEAARAQDAFKKMEQKAKAKRLGGSVPQTGAPVSKAPVPKGKRWVSVSTKGGSGHSRGDTKLPSKVEKQRIAEATRLKLRAERERELARKRVESTQKKKAAAKRAYALKKRREGGK